MRRLDMASRRGSVRARPWRAGSGSGGRPGGLTLRRTGRQAEQVDEEGVDDLWGRVRLLEVDRVVRKAEGRGELLGPHDGTVVAPVVGERRDVAVVDRSSFAFVTTATERTAGGVVFAARCTHSASWYMSASARVDCPS